MKRPLLCICRSIFGLRANSMRFVKDDMMVDYSSSSHSSYIMPLRSQSRRPSL